MDELINSFGIQVVKPLGLASLLLFQSMAYAADEPVLEVIPPPPPGAGSLTPTSTTAIPQPLSPMAAPSLPAVQPLPKSELKGLIVPAGLSGSAAARGELSAPAYVTAIAGNRSVLLSWYPSEGGKAVSGYLVYRGLSPAGIDRAPINKALVSDPNFSDSEANSVKGPSNRHTYFYKVRAFDLDGKLSPYSEIVSALPNGPLLPPGRVDAVAVDGKVILNWTEPLSTGDSDLAKLWILRGESSGHLTPVAAVAPDALRWEEGGLANGKPLYYALRSEDAQGHQSPDSPEVRAVPFQPLRPPQHLSALGVGDAVVRLKWDPPASGGSFAVKGYNFYRSTGSVVDLTRPPMNKVLIPGDKVRWEDDSDGSMDPPKLGQQYTYALVAVDSEDNPSPASGPSSAGPVPSVTNLNPGEIDVFGENTLSIQGRKTISVSDTWVKQDSANQQFGSGAASGFSLDQQLQVRLTGKVGRKIKVDVDYDDKAAANQQQKISVVYTGDQQEVFKEFAFGDIQMDLGAGRTEFSPYNKSLFGAKLKLVSPDEKLRLTAIGAQTKGFTETKHFVGGYESVKTGNDIGKNIQDLAFTPYKYYYLSRDPILVEGSDSIQVGSVKIYYDLPSSTVNVPSHIVATAANGTVLNLVPMVQGTDYLVDNSSGLVTFLDGRLPQPTTNLVVAYIVQHLDGTLTKVGYNAAGNDVDFSSGGLTSNSGSGHTDNTSHMIQFGSANPGQYDGHMSLQFYNLGDRDILSPKSDPDFKLNIYGPNQTLIYQLDPRSDYTNVVDFDTRGGWMRFRVPYPFAKTTSGPGDLAMDIPAYSKVGATIVTSAQDAYSSNNRINNFNIHIEYKHKLSSYSLRFNIIRGSETIFLDGRRLTRDSDYFLDYDTGILVFSNPDLVKDSSTVDASYEYMPFGGQYTSTVWGARAEYDLTKDLSIGSSFLWNSADAPQDTPDVKSAPYSLQLLDGDVQMNVPQESLDSLTRKIPGLPAHGDVLKIKAKAEAAHSWLNPNTYSRNNENGVAMVDNFESIDAITAVSLDDSNWMPGSQPAGTATANAPAFSDRRFGALHTQTLPSHTPPNSTTNSQDLNKPQLQLQYCNMDTPQRWDGFVYSFGPSPNLAVGKSDQLEFYYYADSPVTLHIDVGDMSEDSVGNKALATESTTGIISDAQDTGLLFSASQGSPYPLPQPYGAGTLYCNQNYWGAANKRLDTEDLDGNGALNLNNNYYSFVMPLPATSSNTQLTSFLAHVTRDLSNPDNIVETASGNLGTVLSAQNYYTDVKRVRFWIDHCVNPSGTFRLETLQFTGNNWQIRSDPNLSGFQNQTITTDVYYMKVTGVQQQAGGQPPCVAGGYIPDTNFFNTSNGNSSLTEQALQVQYRLTKNESSSGHPYFQARRLLGNGTNVDLGGYKKLRVDIYKPFNTLPGERFLLRLATDDLNYFEYVIPLDTVATNTWQTVQLALDGSDGYRTQTGFPYLRQVNYCALMVDSVSSTLSTAMDGCDPNNALAWNGSEVLWLDNLRVTDSIARDGGASKVAMNYNFLGGAVTVDHSIRDVDSDFVMIDQQGNLPARHSISQVLDAKVNAFKDYPMALHYEDNQQFVDPNNVGDPNYSRNFLDPDQSDQKTSGSLGINKVPLVPGLTVNSNGYTQHIRQIFLPDEIRQVQTLQNESITPNTTLDNRHLSSEAVYKIPTPAWGIGGDEFHFEMDYDDNQVQMDQQSLNPANLAYRDQDRHTYTFKGRYSGTYKWGHWLTLSPSYAYSLVQASGSLPAPTVYNGTGYYTLDANGNAQGDGPLGIPQSRAINPSMTLQFADLMALKAPKISYNFTQTRDYVRNELRTPGSVDMSTSLNMANAGDLFKGWPAVDVSQSYQVDSVVNNDLRIRSDDHTQALLGKLQPGGSLSDFGGRYDLTNLQVLPNIALAEQQPWYQSTWWVRLGNAHGGLAEDANDPLNIEDIAVSSSWRSVTNLSSRFDYALVPGWATTWSPHFSKTDARTMAAPEQVTLNDQWGAGLGADLKEPHIPFWQTLHPSNMSLGYDYSSADNYVEPGDQITSSRISNTLRFALPTKPSDSTTLTLSVNWTQSTDYNYTPGSADATNQNDSSLWEPDIKLVYYMNIDHSYKMWDMWPFYGRELRVKQTFRLDNELDVQLKSGVQTVTTVGGTDSGSTTYILRDTLSYNALDNVKVNFSLEQHLYNNAYADQAINQSGNYYSIKISLGVEATF